MPVKNNCTLQLTTTANLLLCERFVKTKVMERVNRLHKFLNLVY